MRALLRLSIHGAFVIGAAQLSGCLKDSPDLTPAPSGLSPNAPPPATPPPPGAPAHPSPPAPGGESIFTQPARAGRQSPHQPRHPDRRLQRRHLAQRAAGDARSGLELNVDAPSAFGMAVTYDGKTRSHHQQRRLALLGDPDPQHHRRPAPRSSASPSTPPSWAWCSLPTAARFYASGGENGNVWVGDVATATHHRVGQPERHHPSRCPSPALADPPSGIITSFRGSFPGAMAITATGKYLYVVDQGNFSVHVIDTAKIAIGVDADKKVVEMNNFAAVVGNVKVGRYPFGITLGADDSRLYVANVGVFQYTHLIPRGPSRTPGGTEPPNPTGDPNADYPLCYPGVGYPDEVAADKVIKIKKIPGPHHQRPAAGPARSRGHPLRLRARPIASTRSPAWAARTSTSRRRSTCWIWPTPPRPAVVKKVKTGLQVGEVEDGIATTGASHPNAVAIGRQAIFVSNGNNDSISVLDPDTLAVVRHLQPGAAGRGRSPAARQPAGVAGAQPRGQAAVRRRGRPQRGRRCWTSTATELSLAGRIPTGWWPSARQAVGRRPPAVRRHRQGPGRAAQRGRRGRRPQRPPQTQRVRHRCR